MTSLPKLPSSICVRLTRRCNARCAFCQAPDTDRYALSIDQFDRLCGWLHANRVNSVKLSGGEPTVRNDLPALVDAGHAHDLKVTLITNGLVLRDTVLRSLRRAGAEIKFSIHHPGRANDLALGRVSFDKVVANLRRARTAGVPCSINTVVSRKNRRELSDLTKFAADLDCRKISFIPFVPRGRGLQQRSSFELSASQLPAVRTEILGLSVAFDGRIVVRCIDLRAKPYWIVENDLSLVEESWIESADRVVLSPEAFDDLISGRSIQVQTRAS